jgi:hypothetical protein
LQSRCEVAFMECLKKEILCITILLLIVQMTWSIPVNGRSFQVARVTDIDYPQRVASGQDFSVVVTFEYASNVLVDVGIFEEKDFRVVQSLTLISGFYGPGNVTFFFNLTAPESTGTWRLVASTRAWWADSWFSDPDFGSKPFAVQITSQDQFWFNVTSKYPFEVDGLRIDPSGRREVGLFLSRGRHTISAEQMLAMNGQTRLVFDHWTDGVRSNPRTVNLFSDAKLTTVYRTQYFLSVNSEYGEPAGSGWYDENTTSWFGVLPEMELRAFWILEERLFFDKWTGDSTEHAPVGSILMTGPKRVQAVWQSKFDLPFSVQLHLLSISMILISVLFFVRGRRRKRVGTNRKRSLRLSESRRMVIVLFITLLVCSSGVPTRAIENTIIKIGETSWRHWQNLESDTCVIWLGGGVESSPLTINPYWLESYNTMRFVQDLARYYSVLTLETGSSMIYQPQLQRTVRVELYPSRIIRDARRWATETGYRCVYLVGYSVGGIAAAHEAMIGDREAWSGPNGIILITVPLEQFLPYTSFLKASHLILYGTEMTKSFIDSGMKYYQSTPADGTYDDYWLHKEFKVINNVAHEVWTKAKTGIYDAEAIQVCVGFIERSKSLQFEGQRNFLKTSSSSVEKLSTNSKTRVELTKVSFPSQVLPEEIFRISVTIRMQSSAQTRAWAMLHFSNASSILSVRELLSSRNESMNLTLLSRAPIQRTRLDLRISVLCNEGELWTFPTGNYSIPITIEVRGEVTLSVKTSLPGIPLQIDAISLTTDNRGVVNASLLHGPHVIEVPSLIQLTNVRRAIFQGWSDGPTGARRTIRLSESVQIEALFRFQYYVSGFSEFGHLTGEGWYDQNATVVVMVFPPLLQERIGEALVVHRFERWSIGADSKEIPLAIRITEPLEVKAYWVSVSYKEEIPAFLFAEVLLSFLLLAFSIVLTRKRSMSK